MNLQEEIRNHISSTSYGRSHSKLADWARRVEMLEARASYFQQIAVSLDAGLVWAIDTLRTYPEAERCHGCMYWDEELKRRTGLVRKGNSFTLAENK